MEEIIEESEKKTKRSKIKVLFFVFFLLLFLFIFADFCFRYFSIEKISNFVKKNNIGDKKIVKQIKPIRNNNNENELIEKKSKAIDLAFKSRVEENSNKFLNENNDQQSAFVENTSNNVSINNDNGEINEFKNNNNEYDKLVEKLSSSVVHIKGIYLTDIELQQRYELLTSLGGEVFPPKKIKMQGTCSGFFVSQDGYIVTNHHCIDDVKDINIETKNGNTYNAKIVGYYEGADLAVLKIEPKKGEKFNAVKIGNSDNLSVGDNIIVIGGPLGYKWSASAGIVSGKSRDIDYTGNEWSVKKRAWGTAGEYIQVDAAINGGNSGGPAFNINGEVVGIASAGYTFLQGMKFIIASNTLLDNLSALKSGKIIQKGLWGVNINELEPYDVKALNMNKNTGVLIHEVVKGGPADKAGIKRGDVILKIDNKEIKDKVSLRNASNSVFDGSISDIEVNRYGDILKFKVKAISVKEIEKLEKGEIGIQEWNDKNISYRLLTKRMHEDFRFPKEISGIIITDIKNNEDPLITISIGNIIMQVNGIKINSIEDYQAVISDLKKNKKQMAMFHLYNPTQRKVIVRGSKFE